MSDERWVALLRGVNVGGKNLVNMAMLRTLFAEQGCGDAASYIQSGNVVFRAAGDAAAWQERLARAIERHFGFAVPVVVRRAAELERVLAQRPFPGVDEDHVAVMFLRDRPTEEGLARLEQQRFLPEQFAVIGAEIFLAMPNGAGRSKMTSAYFDTRLKTVGTSRNLRTIRRLLEMAFGDSRSGAEG